MDPVSYPYALLRSPNPSSHASSGTIFTPVATLLVQHTLARRGVVQVLQAAVCPFRLSRHHRQPQSHCRPLALRWTVGGQL